jgi:hypothetical protein
MSTWPSLDLSRWGATKRTLHHIAQMLGKVRLALAPHQPNFLFAALYLTPSGFATRPIPVGLRLIEVQLDVFAPKIVLASSDGRRHELPFAKLSNIAATYTALLEALRELDVDVTLSPVPQELLDLTPLNRDEHPPTWVAEDAQAWHTVMSATQCIFDRWRAHFFGRSGIQLWWGAFDLTLLLFSGSHASSPTDRGYLFKYDLDAEMMNAGFYLGDDDNAPFYYGYIYPEPAACNEIAIAEPAVWSEQLREWILPYDAVRNAPHPEELLRSFLSGIYDACGSAAQWDRSAYTYVPPPLRHARLK